MIHEVFHNLTCGPRGLPAVPNTSGTTNWGIHNDIYIYTHTYPDYMHACMHACMHPSIHPSIGGIGYGKFHRHESKPKESLAWRIPWQKGSPVLPSLGDHSCIRFQALNAVAKKSRQIVGWFTPMATVGIGPRSFSSYRNDDLPWSKMVIVQLRFLRCTSKQGFERYSQHPLLIFNQMPVASHLPRIGENCYNPIESLAI